MASQVLSGNGNLTYVNNTGQNVRVIINFIQGVANIPNLSGNVVYQSSSSAYGITLTWSANNGGVVSINAPSALAMGRNLAYSYGAGAGTATTDTYAISAYNMVPYESGTSQKSNSGLPTEIMLAANQSFTATCSAYNVVVIPENG